MLLYKAFNARPGRDIIKIGLPLHVVVYDASARELIIINQSNLIQISHNNSVESGGIY